jgi:hypothetical protein
MPAGDSIPGWGLTSGPGSSDPVQRGVPDWLAEAWQIYRSRLGPVLSVALAIQGPLGLLYAPASVALTIDLESRWSQLTTMSPSDPNAIPQMMAVFLPGDWLSVLSRSVGPAAGFLALILLTAAFALILVPEEADGQATGLSWRQILERSRPFALPVAVVGVLGVAFTVLEDGWVSSYRVPAPIATDQLRAFPSSTGWIFALDGLILIGAVALIYSIGRWALSIPVAIVERMGLRPALTRSSQLTAGHRLSVVLTFLVVSFATSLVTSVALFGSSALAGALSGSGSTTTFLLCLVATLAAFVLTAPLVPIMLVVLYQGLSGLEDPSSPGATIEPSGP